MPETRICKQSGQKFTITDRDLEFYKRINVPPPTLCPEERCRRRFAFRNERSLYKRKSSISGKEIIACVHPDAPFPVYTQKEWWGDSWHGLDFARDYDFNKPFFEQFYALMKEVPIIAINGVNNENTDYANYAAACKNCYMVCGSVYCEDSMYGNPYYCTSCIDSMLIRDCELCYECITCERCYECFYCQDCVGSNNLIYCYDCIGCSDCVGCVGLRNKKYHIFNKKYSREDYERIRKTLDLKDPNQLANIKRNFEELKLKTPRKSIVEVKTENVTGNYIYASKNTFDCFDVQRCEDVSYCAQVIDMKDCYDCNYTEENELCYEYICNYHNQRIFFSVWMYNCNNIWYSANCVASQDLFGCCGVRNKQYCILNKQYSEQEYKDLKVRIVEQMRQDESFGEFFPVQNSWWAYNETVAQEYFPLSKEEALVRGYRWRD